MKAAIVRPNSANFSIEDIGIGGPRDDEILVNSWHLSFRYLVS